MLDTLIVQQTPEIVIVTWEPEKSFSVGNNTRSIDHKQETDERLAAIDAASVIARQKREAKRKEIEMEEKLKLMELHEKELLVEEENQVLEEAIRLNAQREAEIRNTIASLDVTTNALRPVHDFNKVVSSNFTESQLTASTKKKKEDSERNLTNQYSGRGGNRSLIGR